MPRTLLRICVILLLAAPMVRADPQTPGDKLPVYDSQYYTIHTDLDRDSVKECVIRMTKMFEEYRVRTSNYFPGTVNGKLPFYLFSNPVDYYASGGIPGSAGVFKGDRLMAMMEQENPAWVWHVVQHEGFHQFVYAAIGHDIPIWLNEGMAEYFGEALFTGDGFIAGCIPPTRLREIKGEMARPRSEGGFKSVGDLVALSHLEWNMDVQASAIPGNGDLARRNYDQAWSMVYFLAHADGGKYRDTFISFMQQISQGALPDAAWRNTIGDSAVFEKHWRSYWLGLSDNPTDELDAQATVATLTSFYARALGEGRKFTDFLDFAKPIEAGTLKMPDTEQDWLPQTLGELALQKALMRASEGAKWSLAAERPGGVLNEIVCVLPSGTALTGRYETDDGHVLKVWVTSVTPKTPESKPNTTQPAAPEFHFRYGN